MDWISVHIYGYFLVEPSWVKLPNTFKNQQKVTTFGGGGVSPSSSSPSIVNVKEDNRYTIFSTPATVLACEIEIHPGKQHIILKLNLFFF